VEDPLCCRSPLLPRRRGQDGEVAVIRLLKHISNEWRSANVTKVTLGKYIILMASLLHVIWAGLLIVDPASGASTPVHILVVVFGGPIRTAVTLSIIATTAMVYPFTRYRISNRAMALMLIPQQAILLMSAGAGIRAAVVAHYADGVARAPGFILADQLPSILLAALYTVAVLEAAFEK